MLTDTVLREAYHCPEHASFDGACEACYWPQTKTDSIITALAARSGVDAIGLAHNMAVAGGLRHRANCNEYQYGLNCDCTCGYTAQVLAVADAIRLALATVEAKHVQVPTDAELRDQVQAMNDREPLWRELTALYARMVYSAVTDSDMVRAAELRKLLGLDE
jgi:hypothetical protein